MAAQELNFGPAIQGLCFNPTVEPRHTVSALQERVGTVWGDLPSNAVTNKRDYENDHDRTCNKDGNGLGAFEGKPHRNPRWAGRTGYGQCSFLLGNFQARLLNKDDSALVESRQRLEWTKHSLDTEFYAESPINDTPPESL
jgi:hypothetical protein